MIADEIMFWRICKAFGCESKTIIEIEDEYWLHFLDNKPSEEGLKEM